MLPGYACEYAVRCGRPHVFCVLAAIVQLGLSWLNCEARPLAFESLFASVDECIESIEIDRVNAGHVAASALVCRCDVSGRVVEVRSNLEYTANYFGHPESPWFHEFSFLIAVIDLHEGGAVFETQDRTIAARYLLDGSKEFVLPIVAESLRRFVREIRPMSIYRVSKNANAPAKAMKKHHLLTSVLEAEKYGMAESGTDPLGRSFWIMNSLT